MRYGIFLVALTFSCCGGCTHLALERRTVNQASTTTDLQYRQVLDNIAMFACNPDTLPWHLNLQSASVQVADQGSSSTIGMRPTSGNQNSYGWSFVPSLSGQRGVVNQWGGVPTIDSEPLELLVLAYQRAIDPQDREGKVRTKIYGKIAELAVHYNLVLTKDTLDKAIESNHNLEQSKAWKLKRKNEELHDQLNKVFDQLAQLSRPATDIQIDNYAQRLSSKVTEETRGEARKLQAQQAQQSAQVQSTRIGVEDEIVRMTREICDLPYIPRYPPTGGGVHNTQTIAQTQRKIISLIELAESPQFAECWVCQAHNLVELAKCGGYVGNHDKHGCRCYVYVPLERLSTLRDFTLIVLNLSPIEIQDTSSGGTTGTVTYSPVIGSHP